MTISPVSNLQAATLIVDPTAGKGNYTTIGAALTAASSGQTILIKPGTYTENLTLKAGVNLAALACDALTPNVTILGKASMTVAGTASLSGLYLKTNSDFALSVTGSAASNVFLTGCTIFCNNNTGIQYTSSNASSNIAFNYGFMDTGTTGITYFTASGAGSIQFNYCIFSNTGGSSTASTISAGTLGLLHDTLTLPITTSGTAAFSAFQCLFASAAQNVTVLTAGGSGVHGASHSTFSSGTASAISVGASCALGFPQNMVSSSNANAITGAGTLNTGIITFTGSSSTINTSTVNKLTTYGGTIV